MPEADEVTHIHMCHGSGFGRLRTWAVVLFCTVVGARIALEIVPMGANPMVFFVSAVSGQQLMSPNGRRYRIYYSDMGAMHSGNHWAWIVERRMWLGGRVIAEGYLKPRMRYQMEDVPVIWVEEVPVIEFYKKRGM